MAAEEKKTTLSIDKPVKRYVEWLLMLLGVLDSYFVIFSFAQSQLSVPGYQLGDIWPLPAIYFLEILFFGVLSFISVVKNSQPGDLFWNSLPWICAGGLMSFVVLGAWTIGCFLIPAMIFFLLVGILADRRKKDNIALHFILFIAAGVVQSLFILLVLFF